MVCAIRSASSSRLNALSVRLSTDEPSVATVVLSGIGKPLAPTFVLPVPITRSTSDMFVMASKKVVSTPTVEVSVPYTSITDGRMIESRNARTCTLPASVNPSAR